MRLYRAYQSHIEHVIRRVCVAVLITGLFEGAVACNEDSETPKRDSAANKDARNEPSMDSTSSSDGSMMIDASDAQSVTDASDGSMTSDARIACTGNVSYEITFEAMWSETTHPHPSNNFPANPHFSPLIGAVHNGAFVMWKPGELASPGTKSMAEMGSTSPLDSEIDAAITAGTASMKITGAGPNSPGSTTVTADVTPDYTQVALVSMVGPSPDWFVGVYDVELCEQGNWVAQKAVDLFAWDAGTDDGADYQAPNAVTTPPQGIALVNANVVPANVLFGRFTFVKQ